MKFSCDNCGAQYLIADEKLGRRGVKVRCKKCSYVIIVRPPGFDPTSSVRAPAPKRPAANLPSFSASASLPSSDIPSGDLISSPVGDGPTPDVAPSQEPSDRAFAPEYDPGVALGGATPPRGPTAPLAAAAPMVSPTPPADRARAFSADLSLGYEPRAEPEDAREPSGLDADPSPAPRLGSENVAIDPAELSGDLGASVPSVAYGQGDDQTTVEPSPRRGGERVFGRQDETRVSVAPASVPAPGPDVRAPVDAADDLLDGPSRDSDPPTPPTVDSGDVREAFAGFERDELKDMRSSLEGELSHLQEDLDRVSAPAEAEPVPGPTAPGVDVPPDSQPATNAPTADGDPVAAQIGNAFAVMFGAEDDDTGADPADPAFLQRAAAANGAATNGVSAHESEEDTEVPGAEADGDDADAGGARAAAPEDGAEAGAGVEWYVAIDDEQVGPLTFEEVKMKWRTGAIGPTSLAWCQGMNDWTAIRLVPALAELHSPRSMRDPAPGEAAPGVGAATDEAPMPPAADAEPEPIPLGPEAIRPSVGRVDPGAPVISPVVAPAASAHRASMAAVGASVDEAETGGWRPTAASALASLVAEEMAGPSPEPAAPVTDIKAGPALPATTDALERLLEGNPGPRATAFGAAEKSESRVRPLPRQPDTVSSVPLRDRLETPRGRGLLGLIAAIVGGFAVLGVIVVGGLYLFLRPPSAAVSPTSPEPSTAGGVAAGPSPTLVAATDVDAGTAPSSEPATAEAEAPSKPERAATGAPAARKTSASKPPPASPPRRRARKPAARREPTPPPPPRAVVKVEPPPPRRARPARRPPPGELDEESLINPPGASRRRPPPPPSAPSLPQGLDETDILDVLRKNRAAVRTCLSQHAASGSRVSGTMTVYMVVLNSGRPTRVTVSPDFRTTVAGTCIVNTVKRWRFPRFAGDNVPVDFPVTVKGG